MSTVRIRKSAFQNVEELGLRIKGAYAGTVTEDGPLVADPHLLFNRHFVHKPARDMAEALARQRNGAASLHPQDEARHRLKRARDAATHEGQLLGYIDAAPALRVKADQLAGIRYRTKKKGRWHYVWVDAYRLRLMMELFKTPLRFFCADGDQAVVLKRGKRTVGCLMPASPCRLDIDVTR